MPLRTWLTRRDVVCGSLGLLLSGCGRPPELTPLAPEEDGLKELAAAYRDYCKKNKRGPGTLKELQPKGQKFPNAMKMLKAGDIVVQWGSSLAPQGEGADTVLAYLKTVPEQGGSVLMQDGDTIKTMSADEFKAAPKAGVR